MLKSVETASDRFVLHERHPKLLIFLQQAKALAPIRPSANLPFGLVGELERLKDSKSEREAFAVMAEN
jgi:hypothetical protein